MFTKNESGDLQTPTVVEGKESGEIAIYAADLTLQYDKDRKVQGKILKPCSNRT